MILTEHEREVLIKKCNEILTQLDFEKFTEEIKAPAIMKKSADGQQIQLQILVTRNEENFM